MRADATDLDRIFTALANPTRRAILDRLSRGAATVNELVAPFALSQPTISSHLRILEKAGLVERGRQANFRPVRLAPEALADAHRWIGRYEAFWAEGLERLETYARSLQEREKTDGSDPET
ncbi:MAG: metalloregulator ArsR/SmtB family transcription factor [Paracoccaceae bacterium]